MHVDVSFAQKNALYGFVLSLESESELQGAGAGPSKSIAIRSFNLTAITYTNIKLHGILEKPVSIHIYIVGIDFKHESKIKTSHKRKQFNY